MFSGYQVKYVGSLPHFQPGKIKIRHILLLWSGDHPAQCEVCKTKGAGGKKGCRRCHICGRWWLTHHEVFVCFSKLCSFGFSFCLIKVLV